MNLMDEINAILLGATKQAEESVKDDKNFEGEVNTDLKGAVGKEKEQDAKETAPQNTNNKGEDVPDTDKDYPAKDIDEQPEVTRSYSTDGQDDPGTSSPADVDKVAAAVKLGKLLLDPSYVEGAEDKAKPADPKSKAKPSDTEKKAEKLGEQLGEEVQRKQWYQEGVKFAEAILKKAEELPMEDEIPPEAMIDEVAGEAVEDADGVNEFLSGIASGQEPAVTADAELGAGGSEVDEIVQLAEELLASGEVTPDELLAFIEEAAGGDVGGGPEEELAGAMLDEGITPEDAALLGEPEVPPVEPVPEVTPEDVKVASKKIEDIKGRKDQVKKMAAALKQAIETKKSQKKG